MERRRSVATITEMGETNMRSKRMSIDTLYVYLLASGSLVHPVESDPKVPTLPSRRQLDLRFSTCL